MPSSHAQNAASIWGYLAHRKRTPLAALGALILVVGIGVSRMFLGVHFLGDVVVGALLGGFWLAIFLIFQNRALQFWRGRALGQQVVLATILALALWGIWCGFAAKVDLSGAVWRSFAAEATSAKAIWCARWGAVGLVGRRVVGGAVGAF